MKSFPTAGLVAGLLLLLSPLTARAAEPKPFELKDGDRVALIGNTFVEREQVYSYLETLLLTRWPDRDVSFRNLGWSGDNVFGASRGYFEGADKGFARLTKIVHDLKPTVVFVSYGMGESFEGEAGLPNFRSGLERMLDMLKDLNARETVLIGPIRHEDLGPPLPDPTGHNRLLRMYADAMKDVAKSRSHRFVDLYDLLGDGAKATPPAPLTDNGIHLTQQGYWRAAQAIEQGLGLAPRGWDVTAFRHEVLLAGMIDSQAVRAEGNEEGAKVTIKPPALPVPPPPVGSYDAPPGHERRLKVRGLSPDKQYVLTVGGVAVARATGREWGTGVDVVADPAAQAAEKIRQLAVQKNVQYFNQWRPANETYIFGFRAHEQGRNAAEMPQFTEPITRLEEQMRRLAQPVETVYELKPQ